ncbi:hypothetical protein [Azohydromonas sp.]|uniref:hypothetical protein n=1 Tax=Azohydromonas sp. TaxID=1872666 RepID=UPI002CE12B64|nr:hypothetical protein [Azohydromonas sp.]HMM84606.1 hypothetical protein [Azohydromonas sp.]
MHSPLARRLAAGTALTTLLVTTPAASQLLLQPGQVHENVAATGRVIAQSPRPGTQAGLEARVDFGRADALTQNMHLFAQSGGALLRLNATATARGALHVDLCVPRPGAGQCDAASDPTAPDILVNLTFKYGMVGQVTSTLGKKASFSASASLIDLERNSYVAYQDLGGISASGANIKSIASVPVPIPNFAADNVTQPITFSTFLRRGKVYRFQLAGAATATSTSTGQLTDAMPASANFYDLVPRHPTQHGRIQLHNLTIRVEHEQPDHAAQIAALQAALDSLSGQVGALGERVDALGQQFDEEFAAFSQMHADLAQRTAGPGALLMREQGAPPPEGAVFVGTMRFLPGAGPGPARGPANTTVDVYLVPAATSTAAPAARR